MTSCVRPSDGLTKTSFSKRHKAIIRARELGARAYHCPDCGRYHLTSESKARQKERFMLDNIDEPTPLPEGERRRSAYRLHYPGGATVDVLAFDASEAVKLAARGRPESIDNLTELDKLSQVKQPEPNG